MDRLIAIIREPKSLKALIIRRKGGIDFSSPETVDKEVMADVEGLFEAIEVPLDPSLKSFFAGHDRLLASWESLLRQMFADYDVSLSNSLGVTIHDGEIEDKDTVKNILSHRWWDDCVWDLSVDEDEAAVSSSCRSKPLP